MNADDIPTEVTKLVYTCPLSISKAVSQNQVAELLAHYWPAIEKHIREQVNSEIETRLFSYVRGENPAAEDALETAALIALTGDPYAEPTRS